MSAALIVDHVSKQYRLGEREQYGMLRETLIRLLRKPFLQRETQDSSIWALNDVSLRVEPGEVLGIIGRNGAGKSTLLKILSKITYPTTGRVNVNGRVASLLEVGTGFHEELTGRENIMLNASILGMKKAEVLKKMDAILDFAGVTKFIDTPIKRYSSGMRLRLGFAVAAHLDPDILIIDEVLAVGDAGFQKKCLGIMEGLRSSGRTVLFVSHNLAAVENLCSRVVWIDKGKVRQDGNTQEVIRGYMDSFGEGKTSGHDLSTHPHRSGSGHIRFTSFEQLGLDRRPLKIVRSGDGFVLRFHYTVNARASLPAFVIRLHTLLGTLAIEMNSWMVDYEIPYLAPGDDGYIDLEIGYLNLTPGRYLVTLEVGVVGVVYDRLEYCGTLEVEASDFYGTGKGVESRFGIMFVPIKWNLVTSNASNEELTHAAQS